MLSGSSCMSTVSLSLYVFSSFSLFFSSRYSTDLYMSHMCGFFLFSLSHMLGLFLSLFLSSVHMYYIMGFIRVIRWTFPKDICFTSLYIAGDVFVNKQKCDRNIFLFYYHLTDYLELDT
jgi:hypothetical protein